MFGGVRLSKDRREARIRAAFLSGRIEGKTDEEIIVSWRRAIVGAAAIRSFDFSEFPDEEALLDFAVPIYHALLLRGLSVSAGGDLTAHLVLACNSHLATSSAKAHVDLGSSPLPPQIIYPVRLLSKDGKTVGFARRPTFDGEPVVDRLPTTAYFTTGMEDIPSGDLEFLQAMIGMEIDRRRHYADGHAEGYAIIVAHWRGKGAHWDVRYKAANTGQSSPDFVARSFTLNTMPADAVKEAPTSVKEAEAANAKIDWKLKPGGGSEEKVVAETRPDHDLEYLDITSKLIEPGGPGATVNEPGIYTLIDKGSIYEGAEKNDFHEFFFYMERFNGRAVMRKNNDGQWLFFFVDSDKESQVPYILSLHNVVDNGVQYIPPAGKSALPPEWEAKVPEAYRYWDGKGRQKDRIFELFYYLIEKGDLPYQSKTQDDSQDLP